jgi:hypothetical protein
MCFHCAKLAPHTRQARETTRYLCVPVKVRMSKFGESQEIQIHDLLKTTHLLSTFRR